MLIEGRLRERIVRYRATRAILLLVENLDQHRAATAASAMAFDAFLSLVPLAAIAGFILRRARESSDLLFGPILGAAPRPVKELVDAEFMRLSESGAAIIAPVSIAAFLWVSSAGISTAMGVFEAMFHSPERPWWLRRLVAIGAVVGSFVATMIVVSLALFIASLSGSVGTRIVVAILPLLIILGAICGFFRIAIRGPRPLRRRLLPGAVVTMVLWMIASVLFSLYVTTLSRYATLYGSLAAVAIFLFWLWLLALSLLVGGEVNAQLEGVRDDAAVSMRGVALASPVPEPPPPEPEQAPRVDPAPERELRGRAPQRDPGAGLA
jgi:membrane protein